MKKNMFSLKRKAEVMIVAFILIGISALSVMSVTRTITDEDDNVNTFIRNSNGNYWAATETNFLAAATDLGGARGWVKLPQCNITITTPYLLYSNIQYIGQGDNQSILYLEEGANCSIMQNEHWTNGYSFPSEYDENIWIEGITFDGNDYKQDIWGKPSDYSQILHGIKFMAVRNITITNCFFKDIFADGVNIRHGSHVYIDNNYFDGIGMNYSRSNWSGEVTTRCAYFMYCDNISFNFNKAKELHCSAVAIEPGFGSGKAKMMENFQVIGNYIEGGWNGIWVEGWNASYNGAIKNGVISNNVLYNITRPDGYRTNNVGQMNAIGVVRYTYNITISNNVINEAGNRSSHSLGRGIWCTGENNTVTGNTINKIWGKGILCSGLNIISNNVITNCTDYGIYISIPSANPNLANPIITDNIIRDTHGGIALTHGASRRDEVKGGVVSGNIIKECGTDTAEEGIMNRMYNITISDNSIDGGIYGIYQRASNCKITGNTIANTGSDGIRIFDGGFTSYLIVSNNRIDNAGGDGILLSGLMYSTFMGNTITRCTDGIDETGTDDYNIYLGNIVNACSGDDYDINGANCLPPSDNRSFFNIGTFA